MVAKNEHKRILKLSTGGRNIVCKDSKVTLSDVKLKTVMSNIYEAARNDADKFHINKYYTTFFSVFISLGIALLTADFHDRFGIPGCRIEVFVQCACAISLIIGIIFMIWNSCSRGKNRNKERDDAVEEAFKKLKLEAYQRNL